LTLAAASATTKDGMELSAGSEGKPTPEDLGIDLGEQQWKRSGNGDGSIEIAFPAGTVEAVGALDTAGQAHAAGWAPGDWVLMRVAGDRAGRVLVFDRNEWECFLDGVRKGEFDDAATGN
jgi:hypothetical protein